MRAPDGDNDLSAYMTAVAVRPQNGSSACSISRSMSVVSDHVAMARCDARLDGRRSVSRCGGNEQSGRASRDEEAIYRLSCGSLMTDRHRRLREELERRLLALDATLPASSIGRLGRTAMAGLRGARLALRGKGAGASTPDLESLAALATSMGQLKGLAMKVGQLMSYLELQLPPELTAALAVLQTHSPPMPFERVTEIVTAELGQQAAAVLAQMSPSPVAAASIGQVHRARLPAGEDVAVKIQYPGIEAAIASDFRPAALGTPFAKLLVPGANVDAVVSEARRALLEECDYEREARYQQRFADIYADHATLAVPRVHSPYCSRRVLTTTWIEGLRFDDFLATDPPQSERDRLGEALFEFYVGTLFRHALYNWDPHPGNYIVQRDGRMAMLDYGSTREFDRAFVRKLGALTRAARTDTRDALHRALVDLGFVREGEKYDFATARNLVRSFYGPMLRDETVYIASGEAKPFGAVLESKRQLLKLHLPGEFLFIIRIRFGVMSVLARLGARANWYRLERRFAESATN
jgi:predicted unusual protein kinase regulating ubiquinone biosynthesis (AarF/ABC1/UbiB family)